MTFAELKAELLARGFSYLSDARAGMMVNSAAQELDQVATWPYREASATGFSPLTITDLGTIEAVINTSNHDGVLSPASFGDLLEEHGDLTTVGSPSSYYVAWPNGSPVVVTYPSNDDTIGVQYWAVTDEMSSTGDTPLAPSRFHDIIVDMAVRRAYLDSDNFEAAQALQGEIDRKVAYMMDALFVAGTAYQRTTDASVDW